MSSPPQEPSAESSPSSSPTSNSSLQPGQTSSPFDRKPPRSPTANAFAKRYGTKDKFIKRAQDLNLRLSLDKQTRNSRSRNSSTHSSPELKPKKSTAWETEARKTLTQVLQRMLSPTDMLNLTFLYQICTPGLDQRVERIVQRVIKALEDPSRQSKIHSLETVLDAFCARMPHDQSNFDLYIQLLEEAVQAWEPQAYTEESLEDEPGELPALSLGEPAECVGPSRNQFGATLEENIAAQAAAVKTAQRRNRELRTALHKFGAVLSVEQVQALVKAGIVEAGAALPGDAAGVPASELVDYLEPLLPENEQAFQGKLGAAASVVVCAAAVENDGVEEKPREGGSGFCSLAMLSVAAGLVASAFFVFKHRQ